MFKTVYLSIVFLLLCKLAVAQEFIDGLENNNNLQETSFKTFGVNPAKTNIALLQKIKEANTFDKKAVATLALIDFHDTKGNIDSVLFYGEKLYKESIDLKIDKYLAKSTYNIAAASRKKGLNNEALKWYIKGIGYAEKLDDKNMLNHHKFGVATIYLLRSNHEDALKLFGEVLEITDDENLKHKIYKRVGDVYLTQKNYDKAKIEYTKALDYFKLVNDVKKQLETKIQLGLLAEKSHHTQQALYHYIFVKDEALKNSFYDLYFNAQNRIGRLYYSTEQYQNAQIALSSAYVNAMQWNYLEQQQTVLNNLRLVYIALGDYKNAYAIMTQYQQLSNRILKEQNKKEVNKLEIQYNTIQKENQIQVLQNKQIQKQNEIQRQKTFKISFLIGFLVILIPVIGLLYLYYQKLQTQSKLNALQEEASQQKLATSLKDQELKLIKANITGQDKERKRIAQELHDSIGGNLASIKLQLSNTAGDNKYQHITKQIDDTYNQVRNLSHTLIPKKFTKNMFTRLVTHYIDNIQKDNKTQVSFSPHPEQEINNLDELLKVALFKIIQELLTNAFKHAKASQISIHLNKYDDCIKLIFEDNGVGFDMSTHKNGIGLANVKSRLDTLAGSMLIDSFLKRGTVINIDIPI